MPIPFTKAVKTVKERKRVRPGPKFTAHGRPCKRTPALDKALLKAISAGAPYKIACLACGISEDAFTDWRRKDPEFAQAVEKASGKMALRLLAKIEKQADENFSAAAWMLERRFGENFARPEIQFNMLTQNNVTNDHLTIVISPEEYREIDAQAQESRAKVRRMLEEYQQRRGENGSGNGAGGKRTVEVQAEPVKQPEDLAPITRKEGQENSSAFWNLFVSAADQERTVEKGTAIYVTKTVVDEATGVGRGNQAVVAFKDDPITISDVLATIDRLSGGSPGSWQLLQRKAGIEPGPSA